MEVFEAVLGRRSVRRYKATNISDNLVEKLLDAARWAPSGGNTQPWRFVVVRDKVAKKLLKAVSPGLRTYTNPSIIIVACVDLGVKTNEDETVKILDMGAAIQNLLIAAHALRLGACWVYSTNWRGVKEVVGLSEGNSIKPVSLILVGYPAEAPKPRARLPIDEVTFREKFGVPWNRSE